MKMKRNGLKLRFIGSAQCMIVVPAGLSNLAEIEITYNRHMV